MIKQLELVKSLCMSGFLFGEGIQSSENFLREWEEDHVMHIFFFILIRSFLDLFRHSFRC